MRIPICLIVLWLFALSPNRGHAKSHIIPQEMVFIHMDNTSYFLGDTLFYKAYVQRSDTGKPTNLSKVLYVELLNQDGYLVERQVLRMKEGQAYSSFCLEDSLYAGFYELRAYTRWQLNFGRKEHPHDSYMHRWFLKKEYAQEFFVDYDKLYSRVFPVYDKPEVPGDFYRDMTVRPLRRDYAPEKISSEPVVSLFPEGGNLISRTNQRVAFEVKDGKGQHIEGILYVMGEKGDTLCSALTENRGRGCFEFNIRQGENYSAYFKDEEGKTVNVKLPDILPAGAAMKVEQDSACIKTDISIQGIDKDSVLLIVTAVGRQQMLIPFEGKPLTINKDSLPAGVSQLTLLQKGNILADRLVFVHHPQQQKASLKVFGMKDRYEPLEKVSLTIGGSIPFEKRGGSGSFSVSVRDNASIDLTYDNGNIMTEMLLSSHIKGFVENPGYYFEADDAEHQRHLDLLLMVQGWRRFSITPPKIVEPYEESQIIAGEVSRYTPLDQEDGFFLKENGMIVPTLICPIPLWLQNGSSLEDAEVSAEPMSENTYILGNSRNEKTYAEIATSAATGTPAITESNTHEVESLNNLRHKIILHSEFVQPGASPVYGETTLKENGKFSFMAPHFGGYCFMHLAAADTEKLEKANQKDKKKEEKQKKKGSGGGREVSHQWLLPNADEYPDFSIRVRRCYPHFVKPYEYYQQQFMQQEDEPDSGSGKIEDVTTLREVKVQSRRRILRKVDLSKPAVVMDIYDAFNQLVDAGLTSAFYAGSWSFTDILCHLIVGDMGQHTGHKLKIDRRWNGRFLSENSVQIPEEQLKYNHLENLNKVYVYTDYSPRKEGSSLYWGADKPEVTVDLHRFLDDSKRRTYRDRFIVLDGYATPGEFYHPDYSKYKLPEGQKDYRRTLYWNPDLKLDTNGEARITFYNNSRQTTLSLEAEGQAPDGTLLWGKW